MSSSAYAYDSVFMRTSIGPMSTNELDLVIISVPSIEGNETIDRL
jgi:hypothetical protein